VLRVALTGGIASGKSYVLARLSARGVPTIDADALVHEALAAGSAVLPRITARFGRRVLAHDGSVDRQALGALVFADPKAREDLEAILHPEVFRRIDEWFTSLASSPFAVADIPLLFETHHEGLFDRVIVTVCSTEKQVERLRERNGLTEEEAHQRLQAQLPITEKARRAHYVIDTNGTFEETDRQVERVLRELADDAGGVLRPSTKD
jgi:dephospho-CoA kinase